MVYVYNSSSQVDAEGPEVQGHYWLHKESEACLSYMRPETIFNLFPWIETPKHAENIIMRTVSMSAHLKTNAEVEKQNVASKSVFISTMYFLHKM